MKTKSMSQTDLRDCFPIFSAAGPNWVYLDSAATSQKPQQVIDAIQSYFISSNASVHRSSHDIALKATQQFESVRIQVQQFINAQHSSEIIWTKGATESLNLVASVLAKMPLKQGSKIVIGASEHHANIVPWQQFAKAMDMQIKVIPMTPQGKLDVTCGLQIIDKETAILAVAHVSNVLGNINPIKTLIRHAQKNNALTIIDGAQAVAHLPVDVVSLGCDFYVFSGHKMFAPAGIGVLYGRQDLLDVLPPYQFGGEMIKKVSYQDSEFQISPYKFEAGSPNVEGVLGLGAAIDFIESHRDKILQHETALYQYLIQALRQLEGIVFYGDLEDSVAVQSFSIDGCNNNDLAVLLNEQGIAIRVGHHCAMPLMQALGIEGTLRVSLACYNTQDDIDKLIAAICYAVPQLTGKDTASQIDSNLLREQDKPVLGILAKGIINAKSWEQSYRQIMLAGKSLKRLDDTNRHLAKELFGCESQVWLICEIQNGRLILHADSPSKIVRGLIAILFEPLEKLDLDEIQYFDTQAYMSELGLARYLSESRGNGINAVLLEIKQSIGLTL
jgi:cysteine desulfurase/selenocysteine lyase